jgi:predicted RNA binding protein YcfA (HicA-like mRNA interferase family)
MKLPVVSGVDVVKALAKVGFELDHQTGSHLILRRREPPHLRITVPNHREIARGTLRAIIRDSGLTMEEFARLL